MDHYASSVLGDKDIGMSVFKYLDEPMNFFLVCKATQDMQGDRFIFLHTCAKMAPSYNKVKAFVFLERSKLYSSSDDEGKVKLVHDLHKIIGRLCWPEDISCPIMKEYIAEAYSIAIDQYTACEAGNVDDMFQYIKDGAILNTNHMCYAAKSGSIELAQLLIDNGVDVDYTAAGWAARAGKMEMFEFLLQFCKSDDVAGDLKLAAGNGHLDVVKHLVFKYELCGDCIRMAAEDASYTVAKFFVENNLVDVSYIADRGAIFAAAAAGDLEFVHTLVRHGANIHTYTKYFESPLIEAAKNGHWRVVTYLLDCTTKKRRHHMGIGAAIEAAEENGHEDVVDILKDV